MIIPSAFLSCLGESERMQSSGLCPLQHCTVQLWPLAKGACTAALPYLDIHLVLLGKKHSFFCVCSDGS